MDHAVRMKFYDQAQNFAKQHSVNMCGFQKGFVIKRRIGSESKFGEVYLASSSPTSSNKVIDAAMKLMPVNLANREEINYYKLFNAFAINHINPHFPLIFYSITCSQCPFQAMKHDNCYVILKEYSDGDLKQWTKSTHSIQEHISFWAQLCIIGTGLEREHVIHKDLHWGNLLYHKVPKKNAYKYMYYTFADHHIYIKFIKDHWILWDMGKSIRNNGSVTSLTTDIPRITNVPKWAAKRYNSFPQVIEGLCDAIGDFTENTSLSTTYWDLLVFVEHYVKPIDNTILIIDPEHPPSNNKIINPNEPYILLR